MARIAGTLRSGHHGGTADTALDRPEGRAYAPDLHSAARRRCTQERVSPGSVGRGDEGRTTTTPETETRTTTPSRAGGGDAGTPKVSCRGLWKVFGPDPEGLVGSDDGWLPRQEMRERTGCVAAVRDVSFDVARGEVFVVMGLSGSGKSTLIRCLSRLIEPTAGEVTIDGCDVRAASDEQLRELRRHEVSMVFQHFGLLPNRRVRDNVAYGLEVQGIGRSDRHAKAEEVLELVGLSGLGDSHPDELSGGMQQRVGLARALATDPQVLLFDEPFSALDPLIRRDMQDEVVRLQASMHKTMLFITHDLSEALKLGDRIAVMRDGDVVQVGTPEQIVADPADDYVADFTSEVDRSRVLTARAVMTPGDGAAPPAGSDLPTVAVSTVVHDLIPLVTLHDGDVAVTEDGRVVGTVDRRAVMAAVYGRALDGDR